MLVALFGAMAQCHSCHPCQSQIAYSAYYPPVACGIRGCVASELGPPATVPIEAVGGGAKPFLAENDAAALGLSWVGLLDGSTHDAMNNVTISMR